MLTVKNVDAGARSQGWDPCVPLTGRLTFLGFNFLFRKIGTIKVLKSCVVIETKQLLS